MQSKAQAKEGGTDPLKAHYTRKAGQPVGAVLPSVAGIQPPVVPWPQVQHAATVPHVVSFIRAQGIQGNEGGHPVPVRPEPGPSPWLLPAPGRAAPALCPRVRGAPPLPSHVGTQRPAPSLGPPGARRPVRTRAVAGLPSVIGSGCRALRQWARGCRAGVWRGVRVSPCRRRLSGRKGGSAVLSLPDPTVAVQLDGYL